jgi:hypothetical protein
VFLGSKRLMAYVLTMIFPSSSSSCTKYCIWQAFCNFFDPTFCSGHWERGRMCIMMDVESKFEYLALFNV